MPASNRLVIYHSRKGMHTSAPLRSAFPQTTEERRGSKAERSLARSLTRSASKDHIHLGPACYTYTLKVRATERWVEVVGRQRGEGGGRGSSLFLSRPSLSFFPLLLGSYMLPCAAFAGGEGGPRSQQAHANRECERMPRC